MFGDYVDRLEAEEKLKRCEDKIIKGKENLRNQLEQKSKRVRDMQGQVPDIEELRKREEDRSFGVWERYIIKTNEVEKTKK